MIKINIYLLCKFKHFNSEISSSFSIFNIHRNSLIDKWSALSRSKLALLLIQINDQSERSNLNGNPRSSRRIQREKRMNRILASSVARTVVPSRGIKRLVGPIKKMNDPDGTFGKGRDQNMTGDRYLIRFDPETGYQVFISFLDFRLQTGDNF